MIFLSILYPKVSTPGSLNLHFTVIAIDKTFFLGDCSWKDGGILPFPLLSVKENHIGSVFIEILCYTHTYSIVLLFSIKDCPTNSSLKLTKFYGKFKAIKHNFLASCVE